jgi:hypothetical protein
MGRRGLYPPIYKPHEVWGEGKKELKEKERKKKEIQHQLASGRFSLYKARASV